jgi:DNA-binding NtrC family response regulator
MDISKKQVFNKDKILIKEHSWYGNIRKFTNIIKSVAGEFSQELIKKAGTKNIDKIAELVKIIIKNIIK